MVSPRFLQPILIPVLLSFYGMNVNVSPAQAGEQNANQNIAQNSSANTSEQPKKSKPRVVFFEESQSFLSDALNGTADPLSGSGSSVNRLNALQAEGLAMDAQKVSDNVTVTGMFKLDISPALQTAISNNTVNNFIGDGGSLTLSGDDGNSYKVNVNRSSFNTGTLSIGNTTIGVIVNNLTGATINGDPLKGIASLNTGTAGVITINGQPAQIMAGLTGNNGVLIFAGPGDQILQIRLDNVAGYTQADLDKLTVDSTIRGALTFGRMPDR
jgi:hypothetical protein